jgi:isocitrate dehydrogenase (NAD+)
VRENTEDLYAGIEFERGSRGALNFIEFLSNESGKSVRSDSAISIKPISVTGTERIVRFAFDYAVANNRKKVTAVTKANIMKCTDGLFKEVAAGVAKDYPGIGFEELLVDNLAMQLVQKPQSFDVLVMPNLYGDIISDLCAGLVGGLGVAPGANIGNGIALFEPTHGSAPKYAGKNMANPTAMILSAAMMLDYLGERDAAKRIEESVAKVILEGENVTFDFKWNQDSPFVGTSQMADAVISGLLK